MDKKTVLDTVDDNCEYAVISEKDRLLLEVNKALTTNIKKLYK